MSTNEGHTPLNFIESIVEDELASGKLEGHTIMTRFPPEPNGYLHIGHAKSIYLNFTLAQKYGGITNLRFDDTNPVTEETEYVEGIMEDVRWLDLTGKPDFIMPLIILIDYMKWLSNLSKLEKPM